MRKSQQQRLHSHESPTQMWSLNSLAQGVDETPKKIDKQVLPGKALALCLRMVRQSLAEQPVFGRSKLYQMVKDNQIPAYRKKREIFLDPAEVLEALRVK